jgi:hypothetical protein
MVSAPVPSALAAAMSTRPALAVSPPLKPLLLPSSARVPVPFLTSVPDPVTVLASTVSLAVPKVNRFAPSARPEPATPCRSPTVCAPPAPMSKLAPAAAMLTAVVRARLPPAPRASVPAWMVAVTGASGLSIVQVPLPALTRSPPKVVAPVTASE